MLLAASGSRKLLTPKHEKLLNLLRITPRKIRQPPDLETLPLLRHNPPAIDVKRLSRHVAARVAGKKSHGFGDGHSAAKRAADRVSQKARLNLCHEMQHFGVSQHDTFSPSTRTQAVKLAVNPSSSLQSVF
jgi:hypothetical protein